MKLTKIAIALVAVLAMTAVVASSASAKKLISNTNPVGVELEGIDTVNHKFTVDGQAVTCNESKFTTGAINLPAETVTTKAVYNGCTAFGFPATVNMGNCHYRINTPNRVSVNIPDEYTATVDVLCAGTNGGANVINVITNVIGSECAVSIGEKTGTEHIIIKNNTNNAQKDLSLNITVNNITATKNKDNGFCPLSGTGTVNNASYNGELTVRDVSAAARDIFLEN